MSDKIKLGQDSAYPTAYDAGLLVPIPRSNARETIFQNDDLPFTGVDIWTAFELSWLDQKGKPKVAIAEFVFEASSKHIVESKSFKYYLNSFNESVFSNKENVVDTLRSDLANACDGEVSVTLSALDQPDPIAMIPGQCVDDLDVDINHYQPEPGVLKTTETHVDCDQLFSHLLKSNCPVTGQPDWASVWVEYSGKKIDPRSFLQYVVSYRRHQDFHESCVERIFNDISQHCTPDSLSVYARYTRRGGLDINPFRTSCDRAVPFGRTQRQ